MSSPLLTQHIFLTRGQTPGDSEGQGGLECCSPWGCKESDMTWASEQQQQQQQNELKVRGQTQQQESLAVPRSCLQFLATWDCCLLHQANREIYRGCLLAK